MLATAQLQRVSETPTSEGERSNQRVAEAPLKTTTTNPTAPRTLQEKHRTHLRLTRNNKPGTVPPIIAPITKPRQSPRLHQVEIEPVPLTASQPTKPNSYRIPFASPVEFLKRDQAVDGWTA